ncbi:MAG: hypothetical protein KAS96_03075, partial [Planctomycetes bacterium]|nr:hypothetical protein [Planctomycetota bacterium]
MAIRFKGRVHAWEPWNEGNCSGFGGMTIDELVNLQKAAYLGFKAGEPETVVCWNAYSGGFDELHIMGTFKNEAWSYFDTYNAHTYGCIEGYNSKFDLLRRAACGKPIWITEAERGDIDGIGPGPWYDLDIEHESLRAEFMAQSYATAIYSGVNRHFFFILGSFSSYPRLLRLDFTPRAGYTALAAVGRFMAGAKPIGRIYEEYEQSEKCHVYAFEAEPDGVKSDVLVGWAEDRCGWESRGNAVVDWPITEQLEVRAIYDYLGRYIGTEIPVQLIGKPIFIILEPGQVDKVTWERQDHFAERADKPYNVMMQLKMPKSTTVNGGELWTSVAEHVIAPDVPRAIDIWAYNFG